MGTATVSHHPVTIGRSADCVIVLASTAVSRTHATIYMYGDDVVVNDEGSANGVQVDGQYIAGPTVIGPGSQLQISDFTLWIEALAQPPAEPAQLQAEPAQPPPPVDTAEEPEEMDTCLEPQAGAAHFLANSKLQLIGRGGPYHGTVFDLEKPLISVGRVDDCDIVLEDPSISRRHAQIRLSIMGNNFTVLDLRSSNGTFLDGQRVKRSECQVGNIVRFGDLAFNVAQRRQDGGKQKTKKSSGRLRLLLASAVVLALIAGVAIVAKIRKPKPPPPKVETPKDRLLAMQAAVQSLVDEGKRRLTLKEWDLAIKAFAEARSKDPLNVMTGRLLAKAKAESKNKTVYLKGMEFYGLGNKENILKARTIFQQIPASSVYQREVRYKLRTINERIANEYRIEGVSRCKARYWVRCHAALCKFFELIPAEKQVVGEKRLRDKLRWVEKKLSRRRAFRPCMAPRFRASSGFAGMNLDTSAYLAEKYPSRSIRRVVQLYIEGKIENSLKWLGKLRKKRAMRPYLSSLHEYNRQLLIIRGKYQEGYSAYRDRDAVQASKHWAMVLEEDRKLVPKQIESFYRREVTRALGTLYYQLGDEEFKVMHYARASKLWNLGKLSNERHEGILNGLLKLEKVAERLIRESLALKAAGNDKEATSKLKTARDITNVGRPIHKEALKALADQ